MPSCLFVSFILYPTLQVGHIRYHGLSWISLVKLFLFRNIDLQRKAATRRTVPKYSKRNRKPEAVILYEVRTAHWEEIVTFFYILGGKNTHAHTHRLMGNLQLNVRKDSYDFDNTTLHVGLYIYIYIYIYMFLWNSEFYCGERHKIICVMSGFRREEDDNRALLGYYTECSGNFLTTFRDNLSSGVKNPRIISKKYGQIHSV